MTEDSYGDRMKGYEMAEAGRHLMPLLPVMVRLDGRAFHSFCVGLTRPFDERLTKIMQETTRYLVKECNARIGYTQSDEISLVLHQDSFDSELYFAGRTQKIISTLAAEATLKFHKLVREHLPEKEDKTAVFDCRAWNVPNKTEAANTILWREQDATKNSISMAARHFYSHKALFNKNGSEMQEMLFQKNVNWNDYPVSFKRGTYVQRKVNVRKFTTEELDKLPPMHSARTNPELTFERTDFQILNMPVFLHVSNREEVIFDGAKPVQVML